MQDAGKDRLWNKRVSVETAGPMTRSGAMGSLAHGLGKETAPRTDTEVCHWLGSQSASRVQYEPAKGQRSSYDGHLSATAARPPWIRSGMRAESSYWHHAGFDPLPIFQLGKRLYLGALYTADPRCCERVSRGRCYEKRVCLAE